MLFTTVFLNSCVEDPPVPIPDLNPGTEEGGDILIYEINGAIEFSSESISGFEDPRFRNLYREYDFFDNGSIDLVLRGDNVAGTFLGPPNCFLRLYYTGEVLRNSYNQFNNDLFGFPSDLVLLPVDALTGGSMPNGNWAPPLTDLNLLAEGKREGIASWGINATELEGINYIATRTDIGGEYFYGWIEVFLSDLHDDDDNEVLLISRFGISQTPGLRVRMGDN